MTWLLVAFAVASTIIVLSCCVVSSRSEPEAGYGEDANL